MQGMLTKHADKLHEESANVINMLINYSVSFDYEKFMNNSHGEMRNVTPIADDEYKCAKCHLVFRKGWSDEEAKAEADGNFSCFSDNMSLVCDDCYNEIMGGQNA